jgi:hypothetical protein
MRITLVKQAVAGLVVAGFIGSSLPVMADSQLTADQTVNIQVDEIQQISVSGAATLHITTAVPGAAPTAVQDALTTYAITSNDGTKKITAALSDADMPDGIVLSLTAAAPTTGGGTTAGKQTLAKTGGAVDVVTGLSKLSDSAGLTYDMTATAAAGKLTATTRTVVLTIAAGS